MKDKNILFELPPIHAEFKKDKSKYCYFYYNHGHGTEDSFKLKEDIKTLIWRRQIRHIKKTNVNQQVALHERTNLKLIKEIKAIIKGLRWVESLHSPYKKHEENKMRKWVQQHRQATATLY